MTLEIARRLGQDGVTWETVVVDESTNGGSQARQELTGNAVAINDGDGAWLTWNQDGGPDSLLDLSDPAHPTVIAAGVYLVSVVVNVGALTANGFYDAGLHLDRTGFNASMYAQSSQAPATGPGRVSGVTLAFAWYIPAGGQVGVFVDNRDGAAPANFAIAAAHIQSL